MGHICRVALPPYVDVLDIHIFCVANAICDMFSCFFKTKAPPQAITSEERHAAENIFLEFRKTKQPYGICRHILGKEVKHTSPYILIIGFSQFFFYIPIIDDCYL